MALTPQQEARSVAADDRTLGFLAQRFHNSDGRVVAQGTAGSVPARAADSIDVRELAIRLEAATNLINQLFGRIDTLQAYVIDVRNQL